MSLSISEQCRIVFPNFQIIDLSTIDPQRIDSFTKNLVNFPTVLCLLINEKFSIFWDTGKISGYDLGIIHELKKIMENSIYCGVCYDEYNKCKICPRCSNLLCDQCIDKMIKQILQCEVCQNSITSPPKKNFKCPYCQLELFHVELIYNKDRELFEYHVKNLYKIIE